MSDLISKGKLLNKVASVHYDTEHPLESYSALISLINGADTENAISDCECVIRCKDCAFFMGFERVQCGVCLLEHNKTVLYDEFCSWARRERDENQT